MLGPRGGPLGQLEKSRPQLTVAWRQLDMGVKGKQKCVLNAEGSRYGAWRALPASKQATLLAAPGCHAWAVAWKHEARSTKAEGDHRSAKVCTRIL